MSYNNRGSQPNWNNRGSQRGPPFPPSNQYPQNYYYQPGQMPYHQPIGITEPQTMSMNMYQRPFVFPPPPPPPPQQPQPNASVREPKTYNNQFELRKDRGIKKQIHHKQERREEDRYSSHSSDSSSGSQVSEELPKRRMIHKVNTIQDSPAQIKKWIEARKRNYPKRNANSTNQMNSKAEMSLLQSKIRKRIMLVTADPRSLMRKMKSQQALRRFILAGKKKQNQAQRKQQPQPRAKKQRRQQYETPINSDHKLKDEQIQDQAIEMPIIKPQHIQASTGTPQSIIAHLKQKQGEDKATLQSLLDYKSNSTSYRYHCHTLQSSLVMEDIFRDTIYMLQAIRHIIKNEFFQETEQKHIECQITQNKQKNVHLSDFKPQSDVIQEEEEGEFSQIQE